MNRDIPFGFPDFGSQERNDFVRALYLGVQDWLQLPFPTSAGQVLTGDTTTSRRISWGAGGGALQAQIDSLQKQIYALGGGGYPDPGLTPDYGNTDGYGNRVATITVTASPNLLIYDTGGLTSPPGLVNGDPNLGADQFAIADATGKWIKWDFGVPVLITEARWMLENSITANRIWGDWQWECSNNGTLWTPVGATFTIDKGAAYTVVGGPSNGHNAFKFTTLSSNTMLWRFYRIKCISSGWTTNDFYLVETEFKIARP